MTMEHKGEVKVVSEFAAPIKIEITRGQKGGYGWTVGAHGATGPEVLSMIDAIDQKLKEKYLTGEQPGE